MNRLSILILALVGLLVVSGPGCERPAEETQAAAQAEAAAEPGDQGDAEAETKDEQPQGEAPEEKVRNTLSQARFEEDLRQLTKHPHRLSGIGRYSDSRRAFKERRRRWIAGEVDDAQRADLKDLFTELLEQSDDPTTVLEAPGSLWASCYVQQRLEEIRNGLTEAQREDFVIRVQEFDVVQPRTSECRLFIDGAEQSDQGGPVLYACRPNSLMAPVTPAEGLEGQSIYVRRGKLEDYGRNDVAEKIVLLDYDSEWQTAFAFGAKAVIFMGPGESHPQRGPFAHVEVPANLPRFYMAAETAEKLGLRGGSHRLRIVAACQWRSFRGRNVMAFLRGTDPRFSKEAKDPREMLLLAAPLDSFSEVPELSPGARDAANCAALLQLAEYVAFNRPRRDMVLCFFDGQAQNHLGARAFYGAIHRRDNEETKVKRDKFAGATFKDLWEDLEDEWDFQRYATQILTQENIYEPETEQQKAELAVLKKTAAKPLLPFVGPHFTGMGFVVLTVCLCIVAFVLTVARSMARSRGETEEGEADQAHALLLVGQRLAMVVAGATLSLWFYGVVIDPLILNFDEVRRGYQTGNEELLERIAVAEKELVGLESSHRSSMNLLKEFARMKDSKVLERLRPLRVEMEELERLLRKQTAAMAQLDSADSEAGRAEAQRQLDDLAEVLSERGLSPETLGQEVEEGRQHLDSLNVQDIVWNSSMRVIQKKLNAYSKAVARGLAQSLTDPDPQRQQRKREMFVREYVGDPEAGIAPKFDVLKDQTIQNCRRRAGEVEVLAAETRRAEQLWELMGSHRAIVALHLSLNLGDRRSRWTLIHGDNSTALGADNIGNYEQSIFKAARTVARSLGDQVRHFDQRPIRGRYSTTASLFAARNNVDSGGIGRMFAVLNLSLMTVMDSLPRQGQPYDTAEVLEAGQIYAQLSEIAPFVKALGDSEQLNPTTNLSISAYYPPWDWDGEKLSGPKVTRVSAGSAMRSHPVVGATVSVFPSGGWGTAEPLAGFVQTINRQTNSRGIYHYGPASIYNWSGPTNYAASFTAPEEEEGPGRGIVRQVANVDSIGKISVSLIKTRTMTVLNYGFRRSGPTELMLGAAASRFQAKEHLLAEAGQILTIHAPYDARGIKLFNRTGVVMLNNTNSPDGYEGRGIRLANLSDEFRHPISALYTARDLSTLNEYRLDLLRNNRINQPSLRVLNGQATDTLEDTLKAGPEGAGMLSYVANLAASGAYARLVYGRLLEVMNDLVTAVVLLLLLTMPFAYALERLIIGTPHVYRQIGWFASIFLGTFAVLYLVNPAFKIAATPIIIFLAFTIMLLSGLVILILVRKLQREVKHMQGLGATVHTTDVSRISTMGAAVMMGISTMRRRPLRTFLTAATVVLLTFTILTFASFGSTYGTKETYKGPMSSLPPRIVARNSLWSPIGEGVYTVLHGHLHAEAEVVPRYWVAPTAMEAQMASVTGQSLDHLLTDTSTLNISPVAAAVGLDRRDVAQQPDLGRLFIRRADVELLEGNGIFLTQATAEELGLGPDEVGQTVLFDGMELTFGGIIADQFASHTLIEGSSIVPVDYQISGGAETYAKHQQQVEVGGERGIIERPDIESAQFTTYSLNKVVVVGPETARRLGASIRALTVYPRDVQTIQDLSQRIAKVSLLPTYYGSGGGVNRLIFTSLTEASGLRNLLVPVVLGGLIIFATMLGSVTDREREIYTFSSLGLAPRHVASLFFAEAAVYAIIGGMGGYLLGQTVARVLGWVSGYVNISVPSMNYSSTNAIATILVVMGTVLVSTIYPAMKASRSANPGIQRSWRIPPPKEDLYDLIFPFTVSAYDVTGAATFMKEHFDNYSDTSLGIFATSDVRLFRQSDSDMIGMTAEMALAPFDLGVNQRFALLSQPSEIEGINEVRILIYRLTGTGGDWRRANRSFINDLRRQLLIWRSLTSEAMDSYRQKTLEAWESLPKQDVNERTIGERM